MASSDTENTRGSLANFAFEAVPGNGPLMIMIHGMLSSRQQWLHNKAALSEIARPVLIDLWGHGESPVPDSNAPYTVDGLVAAVDRVRQQHRAEQVILCTQSFAAGIGVHYGFQHPTRLIAHIFTNSNSALLPPPNVFQRGSRYAELIRLVRERGSSGLAEMPFHPSKARRLPPEIKRILVDAANAVAPQAFVRLNEHARPQLSVIDRLHEIRHPTLLINGCWEKKFQALRDQAQQRLPSLQVVDIGAGHAVNLEQAPAFNRAVADFLSAVLPTPLGSQ